MALREEILKALENVNDPELHKSLVELGMIGEIVIDDSNVIVNVKLTTAKCPLKSTIGNDIKEEVQTIEGVKNVEVVFGEMDQRQKEELIAKLHGRSLKENPLKGVKMIAVGSGKGGVGKSSVTAGLAVAMSSMGYKVGLIDADILGYSIPQIMGIKYEKPTVIEGKLLLPIEKYGVKVISMGNLVQKDEAFIWRGPMLAKALEQFIYDVYWGELDYIFIDMPPGTGDIPLNIMQTNPEASIIIVTTPQSFASGVAKRLGLMAKKADRHILGIIENMSYFICDNCDKKHYLFGEGESDALCKDLDTVLLGSVPFSSVNNDLKGEDKPFFSEANSEIWTELKNIAEKLKDVT